MNSPSMITMGRNFFYPHRITLLIFTILSIMGVDYFVELWSKDLARVNPIFWIFFLIDSPIISRPYFLTLSWSTSFENPYFGWIVIPLSFAYLYIISCPIGYIWHWTSLADKRKSVR